MNGEAARTMAVSVPRSLGVLGEALRRVAGALRKKTVARPIESGSVSDIFDLSREHLGRIGDEIELLADEIDNGLSTIASNPDTPDAEIHRAVGRLELQLERIVNGYDEVWRLRAGSEDHECWLLLVETYRKTLAQIQDWLDELADFLGDPATALRKRGVSLESDANVTFSLSIEAPPEVGLLTDRLEQRAKETIATSEYEAMRAEERSESWLPFLLGGLFGWWIGGG